MSYISPLKRYQKYVDQIPLPFPAKPIFEFRAVKVFEDDEKGIPLKYRRNSELMRRQPSNFPHKWWRLLYEHGPNWRSIHYAQWSEKRKALGLPHVVTNPIPDPLPKKKQPQSVRINEAQERTA